MSDSSSDDEDRSKLLQAVDKEFSDTLYSRKSIQFEDEKPKIDEMPPSLRSRGEQSEQFSLCGLNVTPEFQKHVAKHLARVLDQQLKEVEPKEKKHKKKTHSKKGIRLLHSCSSYLDGKDAEDISVAHNAKRKMREKEESNSEEEDVRVKESAVSGDWVLNGESTKGWVKSTKGEVITGVHKDSSVANGKSKKKKKKKNKENIIV